MTGWEDVRAEVLRRIRARDWAPGALIPGEEALAVEFGVARATVNRALRDLAGAGLLERRRKAGTRVALLPVRRATLEIAVIRREVEARGQVYAHHLLAMDHAVPPVPVAGQLGWKPEATKLYLETLHLADGKPHAFEARWLEPAVLPDPRPDFAAISANEWLVTHVAYAIGDIAFCAQAADARGAEVLGVPLGAAVFVTERTTFSALGAITFVRLVHAPGYRLVTMV